jgi:hypothetical protein
MPATVKPAQKERYSISPVLTFSGTWMPFSFARILPSSETLSGYQKARVSIQQLSHTGANDPCAPGRLLAATLRPF